MFDRAREDPDDEEPRHAPFKVILLTTVRLYIGVGLGEGIALVQI